MSQKRKNDTKFLRFFVQMTELSQRKRKQPQTITSFRRSTFKTRKLNSTPCARWLRRPIARKRSSNRSSTMRGGKWRTCSSAAKRVKSTKKTSRLETAKRQTLNNYLFFQTFTSKLIEVFFFLFERMRTFAYTLSLAVQRNYVSAYVSHYNLKGVFA